MKRLLAIGVAIAIAIVILAAVAIIAAGTSGSNRPERMTLAALSLKTAALPPLPPTPKVNCAHPTASLQPPARMPTPGAMPAGSFMAKIKKQGNLIAGVDQNTFLFASYDPASRQIQGFEIDLLRQIAKAIFGNPNRIKLKAIITGERIPQVQSGAVDIVADAITITCARRTQVGFSTVYYDAHQRLLVPTNSPIHGLQDLGGKKVCATSGSTSIQRLGTLHPRPAAYPVAQRTDCLVALQEGLVDAITSDDSILLGFHAQDANTKLVGPSLAPEPYGMAINSTHPDFVRFVNGVLAQMRRDGTWHRLYVLWLGKYVTSIPPPPRASYDG